LLLVCVGLEWTPGECSCVVDCEKLEINWMFVFWSRLIPIVVSSVTSGTDCSHSYVRLLIRSPKQPVTPEIKNPSLEDSRGITDPTFNRRGRLYPCVSISLSTEILNVLSEKRDKKLDIGVSRTSTAFIFWHYSWNTEYWNQKRPPLLGEGSAITFLGQRIFAQRWRNYLRGLHYKADT
jgi:hypothetical protein